MTMDTTEQRVGFRLPWTERREDGTPEPGAPTEDGVAEDDHATHAVDAGDAGGADTAPASDVAAPAVDAAAPASGAPRRPSRFLADLTRAMHAAAEEGRQSALDQFHADGKRTIEEIQSRSAEDATSLRRQADEDVTRVREWSKAEIARIREETDRRIADRKSYLDRELEGHAAVIEREIEHVQEQVTTYDQEMSTFFDRLLAEDDPSRFAAVAASMPDPPLFLPVPEAERRQIEARALAGPPALEEADADAPPEPPRS